MKKTKIIKIILLIFFIILIAFIALKIYHYNIIINIITSNKTKIDSHDFYYEVITSNDNSTQKVWVKNNKQKNEFLNNNQLIQTIYIDLEDDNTYIVTEADKGYALFENTKLLPAGVLNPPFVLNFTFQTDSLLNKLSFLFNIKSIKHETINNIDTIKITFADNDIGKVETSWFDANTLSPIQSIYDDITSTYVFTECISSDSELIFTDFENYKKNN